MTTTANNAAAAASNTEAATNQARRPFAPIFTATVTPENIVTGFTKNALPYATMKGSKALFSNNNEKVVTLMAFGKSLATVQDALVEGQPIELAVQFDGGALKIIGFPRAKDEAPAAAAA